jgi:dTDP-4-dehydrorhamnose 3,5-epimerase
VSIQGVQITDSFFSPDNRGGFLKYFSAKPSNSIDMKISEVFVTTSIPGVVRGMHLQTKSAASNRLISCISGEILDIQLDLRPDSPTYMEITTVLLGHGGPSCIFLPLGVAHGFQALEESIVHYISDRPHDAKLDTGVRISDLGINLPLPITFQSQRDLELPALSEWLGINPL